jgi:hypothetical protein
MPDAPKRKAADADLANDHSQTARPEHGSATAHAGHAVAHGAALVSETEASTATNTPHAAANASNGAEPVKPALSKTQKRMKASKHPAVLRALALMKEGDHRGMHAAWHELRQAGVVDSLPIGQCLMFAAGFLGAALPVIYCVVAT